MEQAGTEKVREGTGGDETNRSEGEESDYGMWQEEEEDRGRRAKGDQLFCLSSVFPTSPSRVSE